MTDLGLWALGLGPPWWVPERVFLVFSARFMLFSDRVEQKGAILRLEASSLPQAFLPSTFPFGQSGCGISYPFHLRVVGRHVPRGIPPPKAGWEAYTPVLTLLLRLDGRHIHQYYTSFLRLDGRHIHQYTPSS